jgi:hypothetical protein
MAESGCQLASAGPAVWAWESEVPPSSASLGLLISVSARESAHLFCPVSPLASTCHSPSDRAESASERD